MSIDILLKVPLGTSVTLSETPSDMEQAVHDAIDSIGAEFVLVGSSATESLYVVITQTDDSTLIPQLIDGFGLPWIVMQQQQHRATVEFELDEFGEITNTLTIPALIYGPKYITSEILPFIPDVPVLNAAGEVTGSAPATEVNLPIYAGHEKF